LGCKTTPITDQVLGPSYEPKNAYQAAGRFPADIRRVAILPLSVPNADAQIESGRDTLQPLLYSEIDKQQLFQSVIVTPEQLQQLTGKPAWSAADKLPPKLFEQLKDTYGCDGVLFCQLSHYRPYQPMIVGWNFTLVGTLESPTPWWSVDEVFDGSDPQIYNAARRYYQNHIQQPGPLADSRAITHSPRRFAQYTLHAALSTLPKRDL
jgi:hypothetical protein